MLGRKSYSTVQMRRQKCLIPNTLECLSLCKCFEAWLIETNASFRVLEDQ